MSDSRDYFVVFMVTPKVPIKSHRRISDYIDYCSSWIPENTSLESQEWRAGIQE